MERLKSYKKDSAPLLDVEKENREGGKEVVRNDDGHNASIYEKAEKVSREKAIGDAQENIVRSSIDDHGYRFVLDSVAKGALDGMRSSDVERWLDRIAVELDGSPELERRYKSILIEHDYDALRDQSKGVVDKLRENFFEGTKTGIKLWFDSSARKDKKAREEKINAFKTFVNSANVIRSDKSTHEVFKSPRETGVSSSFGPDDLMAQSDRYVYASLDTFPHHMADNSNAVELSDDGLNDRAEIVTMDIADLSSRTPDGFIEHYLNNLFSFEEGKDMLAYYLANVFDTPKEAKEWLAVNNDRVTMQTWDTEPRQFPVTGEIDTQEEYNIAKDNMKKRSVEIFERMIALRDKFDLEPPLGMEVRIPDSAERKK